MSLAHVGRSEAEIEVDAVNAHKQFAERTARQNAFTVFAHHRFAAVTQHASQLNDVDIVLLREGDGGLKRCRNHREFMGRFDAMGKGMDGGSRCKDNRIVGLNKLCRLHSDVIFLLGIELFFLVHGAIAGKRVDGNGFSVAAIELPGLFQIG